LYLFVPTSSLYKGFFSKTPPTRRYRYIMTRVIDSLKHVLVIIENRIYLGYILHILQLYHTKPIPYPIKLEFYNAPKIPLQHTLPKQVVLFSKEKVKCIQLIAPYIATVA